jgi:predicted PurR-regulated permease PerM
VWLAVPPALHQIGHALHQNGVAGTPQVHPGVRDRVLAWLQQHLHQLPTGRELVHPVATYGHRAGEAVVAIFFTLAATWYCVSERDAIIKLLTALAPESKRDKARETYLAIDRRLGAYTRLRFLMVFAVGAVLSAGFYVIGLNYWLLVGAFVGLIEIVPIIGPLIGSILVLAVGLPQSQHVAALSLLWLVVIREFQSYVVNPHIGRTVGLSPLVTLLSVAVVGVLFGGLAVILAVPFTSAVATLIDVLVLGHEPPTEQPRRSLRLRRSG